MKYIEEYRRVESSLRKEKKGKRKKRNGLVSRCWEEFNEPQWQILKFLTQFYTFKNLFFFSLFSRLSLLNLFLLFMCPFIHHWRNTQHWLCICAILSSLLFHTQISFFLLCLSFILIISRILQKNGINYLLYLIHNEV